MVTAPQRPIGVLRIASKAGIESAPLPVHGGYANARGDLALFADDRVYRVNVAKHTLHERPPLNEGARMRYDETEPGNEFLYCNVRFQRLSASQIVEICEAGTFRLASRS